MIATDAVRQEVMALMRLSRTPGLSGGLPGEEVTEKDDKRRSSPSPAASAMITEWNDAYGVFGLVPSLMAWQTSLHSCSASTQALLHVLEQADCCWSSPGKRDRQSLTHRSLQDCFAALQELTHREKSRPEVSAPGWEIGMMKSAITVNAIQAAVFFAVRLMNSP